MATYEKRGHIKEFDENGNLLSKVLVEDVLPVVEEEDLFGDE